MAEAAWASMVRPTQSPMAYTPGWLVSIRSLTTIRPRWVSIPAASRPSPAVLARRPTATRAFWAARESSLPSGSWATTCTPGAPCSNRSTWVDRWKVIPSPSSRVWAWAASSPSMGGRMRGSISTTVTWVPNWA